MSSAFLYHLDDPSCRLLDAAGLGCSPCGGTGFRPCGKRYGATPPAAQLNP